MTVAETIHQRVLHLPLRAQEEILHRIDEIEAKLDAESESPNRNVRPTSRLLAEIYDLGEDLEITDFAEHHDRYAHGKLED